MCKFEIDSDLYLKSMLEASAKDLFLFIDSNREYFRQFLNWVDCINSVEDEQNYLESLKNDDTNFAFVIIFEGKIIGSIGFICIDNLNDNAQIGYCIDEKFQGKGIVTKACKKLIEYGFEHLNLERIEFRIAKENFKSKAVMKRIAAEFEGVLRNSYYLNGGYIDCEIYSILRND